MHQARLIAILVTISLLISLSQCLTDTAAPVPHLPLVPDMASLDPLWSKSQTFNCFSRLDCAQLGEYCNKSFSPESPLEVGCALGLYCIENICAENNYGQACKDVGECKPSFSSGYYGCVGGICRDLSGAGDSCSSESQCLPELKCVDQVCQSLAVNQTCDPFFGFGECGYGFSCSGQSDSRNGICVPSQPNGGNCSKDGDCFMGSVCAESVCVGLFTIEENGNCTAKRTCESGLLCYNQTCVPSVDFQECSSLGQCPFGSLGCRCSEYSGKGHCENSHTEYCHEEDNNLQQCITENNCSSISDSPNSCSYIQCGIPYTDYQTCLCSIGQNVMGTCFWSAYCSGFPVWAIVMICMFVFLVITSIILGAFHLYTRKPKTYEVVE